MLRLRISLTLSFLLLATFRLPVDLHGAEPVAPTLEGWTAEAPRSEIRAEFRIERTSGRSGKGALVIQADDRPGLMGYWTGKVRVEGEQHYRFEAYRRIHDVEYPRRSVNARIVWLDEAGKVVLRDLPVVGPYHPAGRPDLSTAEFPADRQTDDQGWTEVSGVFRAPAAAKQALLELHLEWAPSGKVEWCDISLKATEAPAGRKVRLATIHYVPTGKVSPEDNCRQFAPLVAEAAKQKADLAVLPETLTHTGTGRPYVDIGEPVPGPSTEYFGTLAKQHGLYLVIGILERAEHVVYNVAVLIGPDGEIVGKYRKVCLPRPEVEAGITPGHEYPVFDTRFGKVGMMICYDGFFPEVARELANNGAEVIAFPVAGCNPQLVAARACENHAYIVSSTYCDVSLNWMISGIFGHQGEILAQATQWGTVAVAEVDLDRPTIWGNIGDFRAQLLRHRPPTADEQVAAAVTKSPATKGASPNKKTSQVPAERSLRIPPKEPAEALKTFAAKDGFQLELLAAEPLTTDPVAIEYDENGRAYVVEMSDYPYTDKTKDKPFTEKKDDLPIGRVRLLEDLDGDGKFDRSTIFAEDLSWPTGVAIWQGGIYVAATPDLWYFKDTDGDRKADVRRKVFTGFHKSNVQAVINNLRWGLDHRIYGAGGTNGGSIVRIADGEAKPQRMAANDFRFDPHSEQFELISGGARFGNAFDDWGNRFICNIRNPVRQVVIEDRYLARNKLVPVVSPLWDAAEAGDTLAIFRTSPPEPWRVLNARRLSDDPTNISPRSEMVAAGYVTSTCGVTIYRGAAYPAEYYGQAFLGEVAANLVHRQRLIPDGMAFRAERIDERAEFLTSTDNWFRPVNFTNAPDGTLHVLDMYRETIEHPWSIPDDIKARLDLESGRDRGRIYRLSPPGFKPGAAPKLGETTLGELVAALQNPNSWWRDTAHRLLYERQDRAAVPLLRKLLEKRHEPDQGQALARLHALWSLAGLESLTEKDLLFALSDPSAGVREHAIRLAEPRLAGSAKLVEEVLKRADDEALRVRCQAALSLGGIASEAVATALGRIALRDPADRWVRTAVLSSPPERAIDLLEAIGHASGRSAAKFPTATVRALAFVVGARNQDVEISRAFHVAAKLRAPTGEAASGLASREIVLGLSEGLQRHKLLLADVASRLAPEAVPWLTSLKQNAAKLVRNESAAPQERVQAVGLLAQGKYDEVGMVLLELLESRQPQELQLSAVQALSRYTHPEIPAAFVVTYRGLTPAVRGEVIHQLLSRPEWLDALLTALESRALSTADIPLNRRATLLRNADDSLRRRAAALFQRDALGSRKEVLEQYRSALDAKADAGKGQTVSQKICQTCHRFGGAGQDVGPPLETVRHRSPEELLLHILDPNREVSPNYLEYVVALRDGRTTTGVIAAETPTSLTLRRAEGAQETILRSDIDELVSTGKSIMPEGLEKQISVQEMADLLAFLLGRGTPAAGK